MNIPRPRPIVAVLALFAATLAIPRDAVAQPRLACSPRPPVELHVLADRSRSGRMTVLIRSTVAQGDTYNQLASVRFVALTNASIEVLDEDGPSRTAPFTWSATPSSDPFEVLFRVQRRGAGRVQVALVVTDLCGEWRTFVGMP